MKSTTMFPGTTEPHPVHTYIDYYSSNKLIFNFIILGWIDVNQIIINWWIILNRANPSWFIILNVLQPFDGEVNFGLGFF